MPGLQRRTAFFLLAGISLASIAAILILSLRIRKLNQAMGLIPPKQEIDPSEKKQRCRTTLLFVLGALLSYAATLGGIVSFRGRDAGYTPSLVCLGLLVSCALLDPLLASLRVRQVSRRRFEEGDGFLLATRENAAAFAERDLRLLRRLRIGSFLYAAALFLIALVGSFFLTVYSLELIILLYFLFGFFAGSAVARIPVPTVLRTSEDAGTLNAAVYPQLYALCERAERTAGCSGPLLLRIEASSDLGVERTGGRFLVHLGADALLTLAEEELCQSLLRVFSVFSDRRFRREVSYADFLERGRDAHVFAFLSSRLFRLPDMEYELRFELYQYAAVYLSVEERCPGLKAIEDPAAAASALLRARYYDYWCWEQDHSDTPARDRYEELFHYLQQERPEQFRRELPARRAFWDELIAKELSIADRPGLTLRRQLESLGVPQPELLPYELSPALKAEILQATGQVDSEKARASFEENQREAQELLSQWDAEGQPLSPESFGEVINALCVRGRLSEASRFCDRALSELPDTASIAYPCFVLGCRLLHEWDARGLRLVYRAMDTNHNYIEDGVNTISYYCRMTGDGEALRQFEERAPELVRRTQEEGAEIRVLRQTDDLSAEAQPEPLKAEILEKLVRIGGADLSRVYLVRKTISPTIHTSAMIVRFEEDCPVERQDEILRRLYFVLDDSTDWQFSLFDYNDVRTVPVDRIEGSLFYEKEKPED